MQMNRLMLGLVCVSSLAAISARGDETAATVKVFHVPVASATAQEPLTLSARLERADLAAEVLLHYRRRGGVGAVAAGTGGDSGTAGGTASGPDGWRTVRFLRASSDDFQALIPVEDLDEGVLEYYIGSRAALADDPRSGGGEERLQFASPRWPHVVILVGDEEARFRRELDAFHLGQRSRFQLRTEVVSFGSRAGVDRNDVTKKLSLNDDYWRVEGDYTYRILGWIYSIRLGVGVLRGSSYELVSTGGDSPFKQSLSSPPGLTYGFAEVRFRLGPLVRMDVRATLGAGPIERGFDYGIGGQLIVGAEPGTHFAVGFDAVRDIGTRGYLRLAWATVPGLPMSFTLEATTLPNVGDIAGRVYYGIGHRFGKHLTLDVQLGYATRDFRIGGPSGGLGAAFEF